MDCVDSNRRTPQQQISRKANLGFSSWNIIKLKGAFLQLLVESKQKKKKKKNKFLEELITFSFDTTWSAGKTKRSTILLLRMPSSGMWCRVDLVD
jgi:hypothetical protein